MTDPSWPPADGISFLGFIERRQRRRCASACSAWSICKPLLEIRVPIAGNFPFKGDTSDWYIYLGADGAPTQGRSIGPISATVLPDIIGAGADAYFMVRGQGITDWPNGRSRCWRSLPTASSLRSASRCRDVRRQADRLGRALRQPRPADRRPSRRRWPGSAGPAAASISARSRWASRRRSSSSSRRRDRPISGPRSRAGSSCSSSTSKAPSLSPSATTSRRSSCRRPTGIHSTASTRTDALSARSARSPTTATGRWPSSWRIRHRRSGLAGHDRVAAVRCCPGHQPATAGAQFPAVARAGRYAGAGASRHGDAALQLAAGDRVPE